jgi:hypothetical protein
VLVEVGSRVALAVIFHGLMLGSKSVKVKFLRKRKKLESVIADGMLSKLCDCLIVVQVYRDAVMVEILLGRLCGGGIPKDRPF